MSHYCAKVVPVLFGGLVKNRGVRWVSVENVCWADFRPLYRSPPERAAADLIAGRRGNLALEPDESLAIAQNDRGVHEQFDRAGLLAWEADDSGSIWTSEALSTFDGLSRRERLGTGWQQSVHPDDLVSYLATYCDAYVNRRPLVVVYRLWNACDQTYRWLRNTAHPIGETGMIGTMVRIARLDTRCPPVVA